MISPFKMAVLHLFRQKLQSTVMVLSLALALAGSGLLMRLYQLSESRFDNMSSRVQAVVGPKCGGIEILLGALNLEDKCDSVLPLNLFETLRAGADVKFEDGSVVSSSTLTSNVVPFLNVGSFNNLKVMATDASFLKLLDSQEKSVPSLNEENTVVVGAKSAELFNLHHADQISIMLRDQKSPTSLTVLGILPEQKNSWDYGIYVSMQKGWELIKQSGFEHPIWHNKILSFFLLQMNMKGFKPLRSLINDRSVAQLIWVDSEKQNLSDLSGTAGNLGMMIIGVILCLAGFSIFGMMSIRSEGLRVSTATLEAIGYQYRYIFSWMLFESLLIGLLATVLAVAFEMISFSILKSSLSSTWLIPSHQSSGTVWIWILLTQGLAFSLIGSASSMLQLIRVSVHQELKSG